MAYFAFRFVPDILTQLKKLSFDNIERRTVSHPYFVSVRRLFMPFTWRVDWVKTRLGERIS